MSAVVESLPDRLTCDEAVALMERLLAGVSGDRLPLVAAQAVWGMAPWSSRTPVVRLMAEWVASRFGDDLPSVSKALVMAACARADLADRRFLEAIKECEAAVEEASRCGDERVVCACRALLARALLQNAEVSRGFEVIWEVSDAGLPPALRPEALLALGLADIVRGESDLAVGRFAQVSRTVAEICGTPGSTADWHESLAAAAEAHALIRCWRMNDAVKPLDRAILAASENDAHREQADLLVLRAVCRLASGHLELEAWTSALDLASRLSDAAPGTDFLMGLPADLAGCPTPAEAAARLERATAERLTVRDEAGFLVCALTSMGFYALARSQDAAHRILDLAVEAASNVGWEHARSFLVATKVPLRDD